MPKNRQSQTILFLTLFLLAAGAVAGVYKWVDENGRVQFGDRPPPQVEESDEVIIKDHGSAADPAPASGQVDRKQARDRLLQQFQKERDEKKAAAAKARQEKEKRKMMCKRAQARLNNYTGHVVLYETLPNQKRRYYTDQEQKAEIAKARAEVKKWCK